MIVLNNDLSNLEISNVLMGRLEFTRQQFHIHETDICWQNEHKMAIISNNEISDSARARQKI